MRLLLVTISQPVRRGRMHQAVFSRIGPTADCRTSRHVTRWKECYRVFPHATQEHAQLNCIGQWWVRRYDSFNNRKMIASDVKAIVVERDFQNLVHEVSVSLQFLHC